MNSNTFTPNTTQTESPLDRLRQVTSLLASPNDPDAWFRVLRESTNWRALVNAVAHDFNAREAALIAATRLTLEDER